MSDKQVSGPSQREEHRVDSSIGSLANQENLLAQCGSPPPSALNSAPYSSSTDQIDEIFPPMAYLKIDDEQALQQRTSPSGSAPRSSSKERANETFDTTMALKTSKSLQQWTSSPGSAHQHSSSDPINETCNTIAILETDQQPVQQQSTPKLSFLTLPRELRDRIYDYAAPAFQGVRRPVKPISILCVCRQMRKEAISTLHAKSDFVLHSHGRLEHAQWSKGVFEQSEVRHLHVVGCAHLNPNLMYNPLPDPVVLIPGLDPGDWLQIVLKNMPRLRSIQFREKLELPMSGINSTSYREQEMFQPSARESGRWQGRFREWGIKYRLLFAALDREARSTPTPSLQIFLSLRRQYGSLKTIMDIKLTKTTIERLDKQEGGNKKWVEIQNTLWHEWCKEWTEV